MKNQMMTVKINQDLNITIGHKTKLGKLSPIITYGNHLREQRGLRPITASSILRKQDFWEFVIARNTQNIVDGLGDSKGLSQNADSAFYISTNDNNDLSQNADSAFYISTNDNNALTQNGNSAFYISTNDNKDLSQNGNSPFCISTNDNNDLSQNGNSPFCLSTNDNKDLSQSADSALCIH